MVLPIMRPSKRVGDPGEAAMKQQTLTGFERYGKTTRRAQFLAQMDQIVPWPELARGGGAPLPEGGRSRRPAANSA